MGWKLLNEGANQKADKLHEADGSATAAYSFYPLILPLTVGPGSISVALTIGSHHPRVELSAHTMLIVGAALLGFLAIALTVYGSYRFAGPIVRCLGQTGANALVRLSAFILVCIGMQILWGGLSQLIGGLHQLPGAS